jgi:hypothetical protein
MLVTSRPLLDKLLDCGDDPCHVQKAYRGSAHPGLG